MRDLRLSLVKSFLLLTVVGSGGFLFGTWGIWAQGPEGMEILTRGPLHEAFAGPIAPEIETGLAIQNAPPTAIEEIPPEAMPEGDDVAWIPGYWGWDEQRNDFLWISGIWRVPPPNSNWTPGYWIEVEGGYQWVAGFWLPNDVEEIAYLPAPPESLDEGPQNDPPSDAHVWVAGGWVWPEDHYVWQPGYWVEARPNWVYTPMHYNWTPRGYVYVNGYWDYPIADRGVLFAPVYFSELIYRESTFQYSPNVLIDVGGLTHNLFRYPRYNHYVFGDYYGNESAQLGIVPWFQLSVGHQGYDPIYQHQRWEHGGNDSNWSEKLQDDYQRRKENVESRPPSVYASSPNSDLSHPDQKNNNRVNAITLQEVANEKDSSFKLIKIDKNQRDKLDKRGRDLRKFAKERAKRESAPTQQTQIVPPEGQAVVVERLPVPKSPIKRVLIPGKDASKTPPDMPLLPRHDPRGHSDRVKGKIGEAGKAAQSVQEPIKIKAESKPLREPPAGTKSQGRNKASESGDAKKDLKETPPIVAPKAKERQPDVKQDAPIQRQEQEKPKVEKIEKSVPKGNGKNPKANRKQNSSQPPPNTGVNPNQGNPKKKPKGNQGAQLRSRSVPLPLTAPPPVQAQVSVGKGENKN